jgi:hypothetical protein
MMVSGMRKPFISMLLLQCSGVRMKTAFAVVMALLIACLLAAGCFAQSTGRFQSVGEDYGRDILKSLDAPNPEPTASNSGNNSLWNWGGAPKGRILVDGNLIGDPRYTMKNLSVTSNWLGDSFVDPYGNTPAYSYTDPVTGKPVKTYLDPITGQSYYTYTDSRTGRLVYVYFNPETGEPTYSSFSPLFGQYLEQEQYALPPIFSSGGL